MSATNFATGKNPNGSVAPDHNCNSENAIPGSGILSPKVGTNLVIEEWRCSACAKSHPCIVQIHYEPGFADRHGAVSRFVNRKCVAGEPKDPDWKPEPLRTVEPIATGTELLVCQDIGKRQDIGLRKYGVSVEANPLNLRQWLQHAYEETLDQAIYLRRAMDEMDAKGQP